MPLPEEDEEITALLQASVAHTDDVLIRLFQAVESELRKLARALKSRHTGDQSLQTTLLVDEAFVRLVLTSDREWDDRSTFYRIASGTMRNILADHARRRRPRGFADGTVPSIPDQRSPDPGYQAGENELMFALANALQELEVADSEAATAFLFCFYGVVETGVALTTEQLQAFSGERKPLAELAAVRGQSVSSVHRSLARALAFLQSRLDSHA